METITLIPEGTIKGFGPQPLLTILLHAHSPRIDFAIVFSTGVL